MTIVLNANEPHVSRCSQTLKVTGRHGPDNSLSVMEGGIVALAVFVAGI